MFHNPTAAVNLFHVGKQYLTFCKAEAAVTHNLIGRKIISNVKHSDARNSLPIFRRHTLKWQTPQCVRVLQMNATSNERCLLYAYIRARSAISLSYEYRHEAAVVSREHRMKWVVVLGGSYQWPLPWECTEKEGRHWWPSGKSRSLSGMKCTAMICKKSLMAEWLQQVSQWPEMHCHDLEVMSSNPGRVKLGVCSTSVPIHTWT